MQQLLHLLIVDRHRREALATLHDSRWLLPIACCTERMRAGPLAARWIAGHGLTGNVMGQWLGRVTAANDAMDWLVVVDARPVRRTATASGMCWTPLAQLKSCTFLIDYQQWAMQKSIPDDLPCLSGPFGSMTWLDQVREWVNVVAGPLTDLPVCYKATPYEVVLGIAVPSGTVYFKGLTGDRVAEATLTSTLAGELPESFARTLALERRSDATVWWLTAHCSGTTLAADLTRERTVLVAANLARIQRDLSGRTGGLGIPEADLASAAAWARALIVEHADSETANRCDASLARVYRTVGTADIPCSWIPLDLDAGNVLVDDESVRFIDLDESRIGSVPLALSTLLRRLRRTRAGSASPLWIDAVQCAYEQSWTPWLQLREWWSDLETASVLLDCHSGWQQLHQKIGRGEVHGALELAATYTAQRLARTLDGGRDAGAAQGSR
jgi:hypothetical protein